MEKSERTHQFINTMFKAVQEACNKHENKKSVPDEDMRGVVMLWFPNNHDENGAVHTIIAGHICREHLIQCFMELIEARPIEENKLAS